MAKSVREVTRVIRPQPTLEGAGVRLQRTIGSPALDYLDPFLLLDEFKSDLPADYLAGFPEHPHRGIETVTYLLDGRVAHRDSIGNAGLIKPGDAQWMTAGRGILHSEMPQGVDNRLWGYQLWVNLPAKEKMTAPRYQEFAAAGIPEVSAESGARVRVLTGRFGDTVGPVRDVAADPTFLDVTVPPGVLFTYETNPDYTAFAHIVVGDGVFGDQARPPAPISHMVVLGPGEVVHARSDRDTLRFLLVVGRPFHEPVARWGPFVMNTREQIQQTLAELRAGTFIRD